MHPLSHGIAVITGAASGFGLEASRIAARLGMRIVMADVQADALEAAATEIRGLGDNEFAVGPEYASAAAPVYFNWRKASIYGGSKEIQRNIIAKMVLGL